MHVSIVRPSLVYGPGVRGNIKLMQSAIKRGWFPPLPKLNNKKSMVHVDDLAKAIVHVLRNNKSHGKIFSVTDGEVYSTDKIYKILCKSLNKEIPSWYVPKSFINFFSKINFGPGNKLNKLMKDDFIESTELEELGFSPQYTLREINEKMF